MSDIIYKKEKGKRYVIFRTSILVIIPAIILILGIILSLSAGYLSKLLKYLGW